MVQSVSIENCLTANYSKVKGFVENSLRNEEKVCRKEPVKKKISRYGLFTKSKCYVMLKH